MSGGETPEASTGTAEDPGTAETPEASTGTTEGPEGPGGSAVAEGPDATDGPGTTGAPGLTPAAATRRAWPGVVARAVVVLVVAGIGYQLVVPVTSTIRARLSRLVITRTGATAFPGAPTTAAEEPTSTGSVAAVEAAAKAHPAQTGLYVASWSSKASATSGMAVVTFLLPDAATAGRARAQLAASQLSTGAFGNSGLTRTGAWAPPGIPAASGSLYGPTKGSKTTGRVAVTVWQTDRVVALVEAATTAGPPQAAASSAARAEAAHLAAVTPGFTLAVTRRPVVASSLWAAGTLAVALLAAGGPVAYRRRRRRRARALEEELARTIRVGGSTIVRKRRDA